MSHSLYVVPTPLGNLEDITLRALRVLREARLIAAEDTRTTRRLLTHFDIHTPLLAYHEHNKLTRLDDILTALDDGDVALVSDAGTPGISDPGYELIREAIQRGITVVPLPGASAVICALVASGLPTDGFVYLGFLPRKTAALREFLREVAHERRTLVAYESPHRVLDTFSIMIDILGDRAVAVARELTKFHEEIRRGRLSDILTHFQVTEPRGEFTLVIGGSAEEVDTGMAWDEAAVLDALRARIRAGQSRKEAAKAVADESGWERRAVYSMSIDLD